MHEERGLQKKTPKRDKRSLKTKIPVLNYTYRLEIWQPQVPRGVGGNEREVGGHQLLQGVFPQNWGGTEPNRTVTCMVLKAKANGRRHLALCHDEFRRP
ncbi:hypothetical protein TNCV_559141 [Trichonephila clavipes]|nr:hypothetical protein TNCV_559141 [Trichonephila clavipes]